MASVLVSAGRAAATGSREDGPVGLIKRRVRRTVRRTAKRTADRATVKCPTCGKRYSNPLTHTCTVKTDFRKRKAAETRRQATEARRRKAAEKRAAARVRKKAAADRRRAATAARRAKSRRKPAPRQRPQQHDYRTCRDDECRRHACVAFKEGYEAGFPDGQAACPLPHGGK